MLTKLKLMKDSAKCLLVVIAVMLLAALGAMLMANSPQGEAVGVIETEGGSTIEITQAAGGCISGAMLAVWYSADRKERVPGCWKTIGGGALQIAFADGDIAPRADGRGAEADEPLSD